MGKGNGNFMAGPMAGTGTMKKIGKRTAKKGITAHAEIVGARVLCDLER